MRILNRDTLGSHGNTRGRQDVLEILEAGMQAADPYQNMRKLIRREGNRLIVGHLDFEPTGTPRTGEQIYDLDQVGRIFVFGAAKGVQYAAKAVEDILGDRLTGGHVIAKHGDEQILERIGVTYGAHPVPDEGCVEGCRRILAMSQDMRPDDLVITLAGNGVSALLTLPVDGVTLDDVQCVTHMMQIEHGAPTEDLNTIRNHIDVMKGGRATRYIQPARAIHIVLVDPCGTIGVYENEFANLMYNNRWLHFLPDSTTYEMAIACLKKWDCWDDAPAAVREYLLRADPAQETVKADEFLKTDFRVFGIMPQRLSVIPTAQAKARELGYTPYKMATFLRAEAREAGYTLMDIANTIAKEGTPLQPPCVLLTAGELLVTVGQENGIGGRNQEFALAAALKITGSPQIVVGAVDTDGTDGPGTQFCEDGDGIPCLAGGLVDGQTLAEARAAGIDIHEVLKRHNATPALLQLGCGVLASHNISLTDLGVILIAAPES